MKVVKKLLLLITLTIACYHVRQVHCQRSLLHWKRDLEHRLQSYLNTRQTLDNILDSSIFSTSIQQDFPDGAKVVSSEGSILFSDLIIPSGSLVLESRVARPALRYMVNKTDNYVRAKMNELYEIRKGLESIQRQVHDPKQGFVYKGAPVRNGIIPQVNFTHIPGVWTLKQFMYGRMIESQRVELKQINFTNVDQVMREVYMENPRMGARDSENRLYFEGQKTFWRTVFTKPLRSGCCDRLRPIHTNRMMTRSSNQLVHAPVLFQTNDLYHKQPVVIHQLKTNQLFNRILAVGLTGGPDGNGLLPSAVENPINLGDLISIKDPNPNDIHKTIVFREFLVIDDAQINPGPQLVDRQTTTTTTKQRGHGIGFASNPNLFLDLNYDNYLYKYSTTKNRTVQRVLKSFVIDGETHFLAGLEAGVVNRISNFNQFVQQQIVRIDQDSQIHGQVNFDALPWVLNRQQQQSSNISRSLQNVLMMQVERELIVNELNGMHLPNDILVLPLMPGQPVVIRGRRIFENPVMMQDSVRVQGLVNNIQMPEGVIPLHLNDFMGSVLNSNLWFVDGINVHHMTIQSGKFDEISLKDIHDPQSLILQSVFAFQPDGSRLIRAPLQIRNLTITSFGGGLKNTGLLNGFRPQDLLEFLPTTNPYVPLQQRQQQQQQQMMRSEIALFSKKTFLAPVEVNECLFSTMNQLSNWTNLLIRIDMPNTVQTVHTRLLFIQSPPYFSMGSAQLPYNHVGSVTIDRFNIEFHPNQSPMLYFNNLQISPEFYILQQALIRMSDETHTTKGRYRVLDRVLLLNPDSLINGVSLFDIITVDQPFRFADRYVMVGRVEVRGSLFANRITSNYPIDALDLEQFNKYRIPIMLGQQHQQHNPNGVAAPIKLNHLVLSTNNQATFIHSRMLNGISFNEFASSIMSLTRPQVIESNLVFAGPVNLEGFVHTDGSSLNGIGNFKQLAQKLKHASHSFEDGLVCNSVLVNDIVS